MLQPDYFEGKEIRMIALYYLLEDAVVESVAHNLRPAETENNLKKFKKIASIWADVLPTMQLVMRAGESELRQLIIDACMTSYDQEQDILRRYKADVQNPLDNPHAREVMEAEYKKTQGELRNLTRTAMIDTQGTITSLLDAADLKIAAGGESYETAYLHILDTLADSGITVNYPSGTKRSLEGAVRCCVLTSLNQTSAQITNSYITDAGVQYVLVSAHPGARVAADGQPPLADHAGWQGRIYKISGRDERAENLLESTGYDIRPDGTGVVVDPRGLHGYNCRHSHMPFDVDLRNPYRDTDGNLLDGAGHVITRTENKRIYMVQQTQRQKERSIRKTKRQIVAHSAAGLDTAQEEAKLKRQNKEYNDYCKQHNLTPQYYATYTADNRFRRG